MLQFFLHTETVCSCSGMHRAWYRVFQCFKCIDQEMLATKTLSGNSSCCSRLARKVDLGFGWVPAQSLLWKCFRVRAYLFICSARACRPSDSLVSSRRWARPLSSCHAYGLWDAADIGWPCLVMRCFNLLLMFAWLEVWVLFFVWWILLSIFFCTAFMHFLPWNK